MARALGEFTSYPSFKNALTGVDGSFRLRLSNDTEVHVRSGDGRDWQPIKLSALADAEKLTQLTRRTLQRVQEIKEAHDREISGDACMQAHPTTPSSQQLRKEFETFQQQLNARWDALERRWQRDQKTITRLTAQSSYHAGTNNVLREWLEDAQAQRDKAQEQLQESQDREMELRRQLVQQQDEIAALEKEAPLLRPNNDYDALLVKLDQLENALKELQQRHAQVEQERNEKQRGLNDLKSLWKQRLAENNKTGEKLLEAAQREKTLQAQLEQIQNAFNAMKRDSLRTTEEKQRVEDLLTNAAQRERTLQAQLEKARADHAGLQETLKTREQVSHSLQKELEAQQQKYTELETQLTQELERIRNQLRESAEEKQRVKDLLTNTAQREQELRANNAHLQKIVEEKEQNVLWLQEQLKRQEAAHQRVEETAKRFITALGLDPAHVDEKVLESRLKALEEHRALELAMQKDKERLKEQLRASGKSPEDQTNWLQTANALLQIEYVNTSTHKFFNEAREEVRLSSEQEEELRRIIRCFLGTQGKSTEPTFEGNNFGFITRKAKGQDDMTIVQDTIKKLNHSSTQALYELIAAKCVVDNFTENAYTKSQNARGTRRIIHGLLHGLRPIVQELAQEQTP
jgi:chromosome segregation ATPase